LLFLPCFIQQKDIIKKEIRQLKTYKNINYFDMFDRLDAYIILKKYFPEDNLLFYQNKSVPYIF